MKKVLATASLIGLVCARHAQAVLPGTGFARSLSGQFVVQAAQPVSAVERAPDLATNRALIRLEPSFVSVSCERTRQLLCRELQVDALWRGKVFVLLYPASTSNDGVTLTSERFRDGWQYRVEMPDVVNRARYVRALVQVVLLEMANRNAGAHSAEIPTWLIEGLAQQLQASHELEIFLAPPRSSRNGLSFGSTYFNGRKQGPLEQAHDVLTNRPALSFEELSWPKDNELAGPDAELYRSSAQLFVNALMELSDGRACLQSFLAGLPEHYNWQLAFLPAFHEHFARPLDTEQWWALQVAHFTGRESALTWSAEECWEKLDAALQCAVEPGADTNAVPSQASASLQSVLRTWDRLRQTEALLNRLRELELVRVRLTPEWTRIADDYRQVVATYLRQRDRPQPIFPLNKQPALHRLAEETAHRLDLLDARRQALRMVPQPPAVPTQAQY